jgi:hypothetical protein
VWSWPCTSNVFVAQGQLYFYSLICFITVAFLRNLNNIRIVFVLLFFMCFIQIGHLLLETVSWCNDKFYVNMIIACFHCLLRFDGIGNRLSFLHVWNIQTKIFPDILCLLECNTVQSDESKWMFMSIISPPSSGLKSKPCKKSSWSSEQASLLFNPEDGGRIFVANTGWFSPDYTVLYPRR